MGFKLDYKSQVNNNLIDKFVFSAPAKENTWIIEQVNLLTCTLQTSELTSMNSPIVSLMKKVNLLYCIGS